MKDAGRTGCKRKLTWPVELSQPSSVADAAGSWSPEPHSPVHRVDDGEVPDACTRSAWQGDCLLRSPTYDGAIFTQHEGKRSRFLNLLDSSSSTGPAGALAQAAAARVSEPGDQQQVLPPAASSSSRSWEMLFGSLQQAAGATGVDVLAMQLPATPVVAAITAMPAPPQKKSIQPGQHTRGGCRAPFTASRALPGMAPASAADLQQMRAWLTSLEAR